MRNQEVSKREIIYRETVTLYVSIVSSLIAAFVFGILLFAQLPPEPIIKPVPLVFPAVGFVGALVTAVAFGTIQIKVTDVYVRVSHGFFRKTLEWKDVADCEMDTFPGIFRASRFHLIQYEGKWIWAFNKLFAKRVIFTTKFGSPLGMMVATKNPEQLLRLAKEHITKTTSLFSDLNRIN